MRGGPGKLKLSRDDKVIKILTNLPHVNHMSSNPGMNKNTISDLLPGTPNWNTLNQLIDDLDASACIIKRPAEKHERGDYYYYVTDKGKTFIEKYMEARGHFHILESFRNILGYEEYVDSMVATLFSKMAIIEAN